MKLIFAYKGEPRGQERPRFGGRAYKTTEAKAYEQAIAIAYKVAATGRQPENGPVGVRIRAGYPIPISDSKRVRAEKVTGQLRVTKKPDIDNVAKAVLDALNGIAWLDDRQVILLEARKEYATVPGIIVEILTGRELEELL